MQRWVAPNAAGLIPLVFFLAFRALCGDTVTRHDPIVQNVGDPAPMVTTFGIPTVLEVQEHAEDGSADGRGASPLFVLGLSIYGLPVVGVVAVLRRLLDRRHASRSFESDALSKPKIPWPFD